VKVYAVDLRGLRLSGDGIQQRFHHFRTYASRPIRLTTNPHVIFSKPLEEAQTDAPPICPLSSGRGKCALWVRTPTDT
jgi:hypothetical protein